MYKKWIALGFIGVLLIGGGFVVKGMQYDTPALKDSFTRDFIIQDEQAPEGFHVFESKIDTYTMLFPSDFQLVSDPPEFYGRQGNFYETWIANKKTNDGNFIELKATFREIGEGQIKGEYEMLANQHIDNYEMYEYNDQTIFLAKAVKKYDRAQDKIVKGDPNNEEANVYYGFIADEQSNRTLKLDYSIVCPDGCSIHVKKEEEFMKVLLENIRFDKRISLTEKD